MATAVAMTPSPRSGSQAPSGTSDGQSEDPVGERQDGEDGRRGRGHEGPGRGGVGDVGHRLGIGRRQLEMCHDVIGGTSVGRALVGALVVGERRISHRDRPAGRLLARVGRPVAGEAGLEDDPGSVDEGVGEGQCEAPQRRHLAVGDAPHRQRHADQ